MTKPIFYDASGRRGRWVRRSSALLVAAVALALACLVFAVATGSTKPPLRLATDTLRPTAARVADSPRDTRPWLPEQVASRNAADRTVLGFYMPWDEPSRRSLAAHAEDLDWLAAGVATVTGPGHRFVHEPDPAMHAILDRAPRRPRLMPMVQNVRADGEWDGASAARLLADPAARRTFLDRIEAMIVAERGQGVMFDLELLPATAHADYRRFLGEARRRFAPRGWPIAIAAPVADPAWDLAAYARAADRIVLMAYDEHWMGGEAGPIASQPWFAEAVGRAVAATGPDRAIVALGSYAYDWSPGRTEPIGVAEAWARARRSGDVPRFDPATGNFRFAYREGARDHQVWMLEAVSAANQMRAVARTGARGVALWRLGSEDPGVWPVLAGSPAPQHASLPATPGLGVTGTGEVLRIEAAAAAGERVATPAADGTVHAAAYRSLPTADLVHRVGAGDRKLVALTFDDGPDATWTPQILDILRREGAPATFFVTGANALGQGALLRRIVAEGSEIGNHSTTHPDLGERSPATIRLELNATERLVEAYTGRQMRLFRPPFLGDADPDRRDELHASRVAAGLGYLTVGLNVDPRDYLAPGVDTIVARTVSQVEAGTPARPAQIVLLHDSGGDRTQTLAALPRIIRTLRAKGYSFVVASRLTGLDHDAAMPRLAGAGELPAQGLAWLFGALAGLRSTLAMLFAAVIVIGIARALALGVLAWRARRFDAPPAAAPHLVPHFASVLIPCFNEAAVIESSVRRILASTGIRIEVIVIDDGSTDGTSDVVAAAFAIDPRVRLLTLPNGGKAHALNRALEIARGDIVVALDADTQFEPDTVAKLARWFADPAIGAVAGNAKVGNAVNLVTRWQAAEYVVAQNLERRALNALGAVTVVPGAVGAWRRTALDDVGGYPCDTLAEDQDLTIAVQRAGWRVACDIDAVAWTEAPETVRALMKQRFRWSYGTLQCLWKHRGLIGRGSPRGLALIGLPQAVLFQLVLTLAAPLIDLALIAGIVALVLGGGEEALTVIACWCAFAATDLAAGWIAYRLDPRETRFPALTLLCQRFGYRQLLYWTTLRATAAAMTGPRIGWGKLERTARVHAPAPRPAPLVRPGGVVTPLRRAA